MVQIKFKKGDVCIVDGKRYEITRRLPGNRIEMECIETGERTTTTDLEFAEAQAEGRASYHEGAMRHREPIEVKRLDFASLDETIKKQALKKVDYLKRLAEKGIAIFSRPVVRPALQEIAKEFGDAKPPSYSSVCSWRRKAGPHLDVRNLVDQRHFRGGHRQLPDAVRDVMDEVISEHYMRRERPTIEDTKGQIWAAINEINQTRDADDRLGKPCYHAVRNAIYGIDEYSRDAARHGKDYAEARFSAVGKGPVETHPLAVAELDHTKVDVMVVDGDRNLPLGRPWVVFLIDKRTRMPLGFHITFDPPSVQTVAQCLKNAFLPKSYVKDSYPRIKNDWPCYGVPTWIVFDRAMENMGKDIEEMAVLLGFNIAFCPRKKAHYKGTIERFLGTINRKLIQKIPGTTFSDITSRGDYNSAKNAVVTLAELQELIHWWVIDDYTQSPHRGLQSVPAKVWEREIIHHPIRPLPAREDLDAFLSRTEERVLSKKGIEFENLFYMREDVVAWRRDSKFQTLAKKTKTGWKVQIRYDSTDMSRIWVIDPRTHQPVEVPCTDQVYTEKINLWQHRAIKDFLRQELQRDVNQESLCQARAELEAWVRETLDQRKGRRRVSTASRAARLAGHGAEAPAGDVGPFHNSSDITKPHTSSARKKSGRPSSRQKKFPMNLVPTMSSDEIDLYADES